MPATAVFPDPSARWLDRDIPRPLIWLVSLLLAAFLLVVIRVTLRPLPSLSIRSTPLAGGLALLCALLWRWLAPRLDRSFSTLEGTHEGLRRLILAGLALLCWASAYLTARASQLQRVDSWDAGIIMGIAAELAQGNLSDGAVVYLQRFPNNQGITVLLAQVIRVGQAFGLGPDQTFVLVGATVGLLLVALVFVSAERLAGTAAALGASLAAFVLFALSPWLAVPYTDTFAAPFPVLTVYLLVRAWQAPGPRSLLWLTAAGASSAVGYVLKPTALIIIIATVICLGAVTLSGRGWQTLIALLLVSVVSLGGAWGLSQAATSASGLRGLEQRAPETPITYWMLTGLSQREEAHYVLYGAWSPEVWGKVSGLATTEEIDAAMREGIRDWYLHTPPEDMVRFFANKITWTFSDATFFSFGEGGDRQTSFAASDPISRILQSFIHPHGSRHLVWSTIQQSVWLLCLWGVARQAAWWRTRQDFVPVTLRLALLGVIAYILLFEARARYLFVFVGVIAVLSVLRRPADRAVAVVKAGGPA